MVTENYKEVQSFVKESEKKSSYGQKVTLIAVSKTKPSSDIKALYDIGVRDFGENKVQELCDKYDELPKDIKWHLIGHLQTNKVKYIVDKVYLIHSVDSIHLAQQIEHECEKKNVDVNILIQVNVAKEDTKFGLMAEDVMSMIETISKLPHIHIKGLMTIAPYTENPEENRPYFKKIKELSVDIAKENIDNVSMDMLSMGMTGDYMVAIEEGATLVRVGTGIFGARNYNK